MSSRLWFVSLVSLIILLSLLATGCQNSKRAFVMVSHKEPDILLDYKEGFNSGGAEGYREAITGEYSPSLKKAWLGGYKRSVNYWKGFNEGYDYGWKRYTRCLPDAPRGDYWTSAYDEYKIGGEKAVIGYKVNTGVKEDGYASGYNGGRKQALADSKAGRDYAASPSNSTVDRYCTGESEEYRKSWVAGYKDGYRDNWSADGYKNGYDAGKKQALDDSEAGRGYNWDPSESTIDSNCKGKTEVYRESWAAGYKDGYRDNWSSAKGSAYQAGFEEGYKEGLQAGEMDKQSGFPYNDKPVSTQSGINEEYLRGVLDGYSKGYKEGYEKG